MTSFNEYYNDIIMQIVNAPVIKNLIELKHVNDPIILYGCGEQAEEILRLCNSYEIEVTALADSMRQGNFKNTKYSILSPAELISAFPNAVILITSWKFDNEIFTKLIRLGYMKEKIHRFPFTHPYFLMKDEFEIHYLTGYQWAYHFFNDDVSKQIILNRICAYLFDKKMIKTSKNLMYFEFLPCENEVFVQAGCYDGDTVKQFVKHYQNKQPFEIYTFEADPQAFEISTRNLADFENVHLIPKGLWSSNTVLTFHTDAMSGGASFVNGIKNEICVPVTSIDVFFQDKPTPTFIQLDIEGAELEALKGAEGIIKKFKPKLAICVYHKYEDIYEIPQLLYQYNPEYKFWLQHCEGGIYDTVLYAE